MAPSELADELERLKTYENRGAFAKVAFFHREAIISALREREPVARIVSAHGDPEAFGEREIEVLQDLKRFRYGTPLYTAPTQEHQEEQS